MKQLGFLLVISLMAASCGQQGSENQTPTQEKTVQESPQTTSEAAAVGFDLQAIPVTDADLGTFPFFKLPDGYVYTAPGKNNSGIGITKEFDREYFLIDGKYHPVDGKSYKARISIARTNKEKEFSERELSKSFEELIGQLGGVKVNDGKVPEKGQKENLEEGAYTKKYLHSSSNFNPETYVIRTNDAEIWVQFYLSPLNKSGSIAIVQRGKLNNTMSLLKADEIQKELDAKGRAVLYINFDVDKATLQTDGQRAVDEIGSVLKASADLSLSIEGHTDNTGSASHNQTLSQQRAETVVGALIASGINKDRLTARGFGSEKPLVANDSEENKARNRRVELIKVSR
ncbi:hypothetical protein GCM10027347_05320 [Larkinella harenae]